MVWLLQVKKVNRLQDAFGLFNRMMQTPGKAELTLTELRVCRMFVAVMLFVKVLNVLTLCGAGMLGACTMNLPASCSAGPWWCMQTAFNWADLFVIDTAGLPDTVWKEQHRCCFCRDRTQASHTEELVSCSHISTVCTVLSVATQNTALDARSATTL